MLNFKQYTELNEGGKVFDGTEEVLRAEVDDIESDVRKRLFVPLGIEDKAKRIGSAGHKDVSGDIDFGVSDIDLEILYDKIQDKFKDLGVNFIKGIEVLSVSWPFDGKHVQIDMIPIYDDKWSYFIYKFPIGSKYKSAHRNWMLMAILSTIKNDIKKDEDGNVISYSGYILNLNKGIFSMNKNYIGKTKILKHGKIENEKLLTTDPTEAVRMIFGDEYSPEDVETFEQCARIIRNSDFRWKDRVEDIKENLVRFLNRAGLEVPKNMG